MPSSVEPLSSAHGASTARGDARSAAGVRRTIIAAGVLLDLSRELGQDVVDFLAGTGLQPLDLDDASQSLSVHQECLLIGNLLRHAGDGQCLGLEAGRRYRFTQLGPLGLGLLYSCTLRGAFLFAERFADLGITLVRLTADRGSAPGRELRVRMDIAAQDPAVARFAIERMVAVIHTLACALMGRPLTATRLEFAFPPPTDPTLYAGFGAKELMFNRHESAMVVSAGDADARLPRGNPLALQNAEAQCRQALQLARWQSGWSARVRDLIYMQPSRMADMREAAAALCMSERTLRRRLQEEGRTFAELCDEARSAMAEYLLSLPRLSVDQIAVQLGYAESASFIHAFKRWRGQTPNAFRRSRAL